MYSYFLGLGNVCSLIMYVGAYSFNQANESLSIYKVRIWLMEFVFLWAFQTIRNALGIECIKFCKIFRCILQHKIATYYYIYIVATYLDACNISNAYLLL